MPVIARSAPKPLPPEGPAKLQILEVTYGKSKTKGTPFFELLLKCLATQLTFKDRLYLTPTSSWKVDAFCRSAGLILPDGPYRLTTDDMESRVIFGPIVHEVLQDGRRAAKLKSIWRPEYALEQDPDLGLIPDPSGVPAPVKLPLVDAPVVSTTPAEHEPPAAKAPAKAEQAPYNDSDEPSEEEMAEAFAYAKARKAERELGK
jgi:hypothetical protein